ncbi:MAG: GatB/YqeY domain-containing protein [Persephonella sp.]|nr:MAG: GatB/YqeY domain-containing protein [Persephonella sp.]RUM59208.1 MAG: GatB/YqeY domain-containing protein [Persephonella sp.]
MSALLNKLQTEMKSALKSKDTDRLSVVRMLISEIKKEQIDKKRELSDSEVLAVIQRYAKQRRDAIEQYKKANRQDLVEKEQKELNIVLEFLPKQLTEEEIIKIVNETIEEVGATSIKDMGKVMKSVMEKVKGRADGSLVSKIVKEKLS